ncbi:MAG: sugar phosphate isomerase/epimerase family protein [Verrucomicrobiota bacterium]
MDNFSFAGFADEAEKSLDGQIETLRKAGWSAIELRLIDGKNIVDQSDEEWASTRDQLAEAGIEIVGFGGQIGNWARPITHDFQVDRDELQRVAPRMREVGCQFLRVMSYPQPAENPIERSEWKAEVIRRLGELAKIAEDEGVILDHENCSGYGETAEGFLELAESIDSPAFKLVMDTGNNSLHANDVMATWAYYEACREHVVHVHIKSAKPNPKGGDHITCFPSEDPVQERILRDLAASGYRGWLSIEPHIMAAIHEGKDVEDSTEAVRVWVEYAAELEAMARRAAG